MFLNISTCVWKFSLFSVFACSLFYSSCYSVYVDRLCFLFSRPCPCVIKKISNGDFTQIIEFSSNLQLQGIRLVEISVEEDFEENLNVNSFYKTGPKPCFGILKYLNYPTNYAFGYFCRFYNEKSKLQ